MLMLISFLQVSDEVGATCTDQLLLHVGTPPTVLIDQPSHGTIFSVGELLSFPGTVSDQEDSIIDLPTIWHSSVDGELLAGVANTQGVSQFATSSLSTGLHTISFSAVDSLGLESSDSISVQINTPPEVDSIVLSPDPLYANDTLMATVSFFDADGDTVTDLLLV